MNVTNKTKGSPASSPSRTRRGLSATLPHAGATATKPGRGGGGHRVFFSRERHWLVDKDQAAAPKEFVCGGVIVDIELIRTAKGGEKIKF